MAQDDKLPEFKEVFVDGLHLMASPGDLISLKQRRKQDPQLDAILRRFWNVRDREQMFFEAWRTLDAQIEFKLKREGAPYFAVYGVRGIGKSEVAAAIMERLRVAFRVLLGIETVPAFGRNPSDMNQLLARATQANRVAVVIGDETETETGLGRNTEADALIDNLETIRLLLHPVIRCANRYQKLKLFSYYCDFVFEVLFQDRDNRINYCIMYKIDEEVSGSDPRIPIAMINIPLHTNEALRRAYRLLKEKEQVEFTSAGGRRSRVKAKMEPFVTALMDYCITQGLEAGKGKDITKPDRLLSKLVFHVKDGDKWNTGEQKLICEEAYDRLSERKEEGMSPPPDSEREFVWESDFSWREEMALIMQDHPQYKQYHSVFLASEIMGLNPYKNAKQFEELTHFKKSANWKWLNRMKNDEGFQGWLKETRAKLHEKYVAQRLRAAGWDVQEQPEFDWEGLHYQEDLYATRNDKPVWINCKCGSGNRTYVADEYKTTYILANQAHAEAYIVYLDLEENVHDIFLPGDRFSVGSRGSGLAATDPTDGKDTSTPLLLLRALAGPAMEAREEPAEPCVEAHPEPNETGTAERLLEATVELARVAGLETAERTLGKEWDPERAAAIMAEVRSRLRAESPAAKKTKRKGTAHTRGARGRVVRGKR
jgi:hypothetical protein